MRPLAALLLSIAATLGPTVDPARAETGEQACPGLVAAVPPLVRPAALARNEVGLTFVGHATWLIESAGGLRVATDYNDYVRPAVTPEIATMNRAHSTHFSFLPDSAIRYVLKGWNPGGGPARHDLQVADVRVRNVPTNIRDWSGGTEADGNSIFVVETADLCIAHLGHLHHTLNTEQLKALGRIDVVLVPVDGSYTLDTEGMMEVLQNLGSPLMLPMHYFNPSTLNRFLAKARERWPVEFSSTATLTLSRETLPKAPKVLVLPGR
jgi:L-ascorbate metabolism protein UlaG (beta-lactamase superfamily)